MPEVFGAKILNLADFAKFASFRILVAKIG